MRPADLFPAGAGRNCLYLLVIFLVSRLSYFAAGVRFLEDLTGLIQIADPSLLREDLFRTVLLLHAQPPLFNLFVGFVLRCFGEHALLAFNLIYLLAGLCLTLSIYLLALRLNIKPRRALLLSGLFTVAPATILLENWAFYTYPLALLLISSALALNIYLERRTSGWLFCLFSLLAMVVLTRSMFHPLWVLAVPLTLCRLLPDRRRQIAAAAAVPLLLVGLWMAKNYYTVGSLTTSTMLGMNFYKITIMQVPDEDRVRMHAEGDLSKYGLYANFESIDYYREKIGTIKAYLPTGIPIMDNARTTDGFPNFNNPAYVDISRRFLRDDISVIIHRPSAYLRGVLGAASLYLQPPHDQVFSTRNVERIAPALRVTDVLLYGQLSSLWRDNYHTEFKTRIKLANTIPDIGLFVLIALLVILIYWPAVILTASRSYLASPHGGTILFMLALVTYVTLLANLIEIGENARIRYEVEPFIWLLFTAYLARKRESAPEDGYSQA